ncbi:DUF6115 domain-containing protein [Robertmurraya andreesenii]|uniref:Coupling factor for flagellin transcription and translation n=1 Tax=Anoxybacillus andreesenii TaxID=1325932 RepID=A0ABT9V757_9BACL|nr:hypothetical protein [Robertmurraya andreesenii]MDQ0156787.1 hypothetical protein [Robertmurraya andreesenii]
MVNLFLILSFVLNGIAFFCIIILYLRQNRFLEVEKKQEKLISEMEEVISSYLVEMTEENEKFIQRVKELIPNFQAPPSEESSTIDTAQVNLKGPQGFEPEMEKQEPPTFRRGTVFQAVQAYKNISDSDNKKHKETPLTTETELQLKKNLPEEKAEQKENNTTSSDLYTQSFYYQALLLQKQGLSIEDIARRLNKGKTEIELLFKLRQNKKE